MVDITHKNVSLRQAIAQAVVCVSKPETIEAIEKNLVPKGNVFEMAKTAGLFAVKRTSDMIPDCHPLPVEYTAVKYEINGLEISINMEVKTIYRTGVEVEAMHGVSVVALTMYDMLKPIDKHVEIGRIKLLEKHGGKSSFSRSFSSATRAAVILASDVVFSGQKEDKTGLVILGKLKEHGITDVSYTKVREQKELICKELEAAVNAGNDIILVAGSTGLNQSDVVPESLAPLIEKEIPGMAEAMRSYGQQRTPFAMLSRSMAGIIGKSIVLTLPGSSRGALESMDAVLPYLNKALGSIRVDSSKR